MHIISLGLIGIAIVLAIVVGLSKCYHKASKTSALIKTGGRKDVVITDGGTIVLPVINDYQWVSMITHKVEVDRSGMDALLTLDGLKVDITATFYIRVDKSEEGVKQAARTLGQKASSADSSAIEEQNLEKLVDALRSVASKMEMRDIQYDRDKFREHVLNATLADMKDNGLVVENCAISRLDQTDIRHFNPENQFEAQGLRNLTQLAEISRQEINGVKQDTKVKVAEQDRDAEVRSLEIKQELIEINLNQQLKEEKSNAENSREIEQAKAHNLSQTEQSEALSRSEIETAKVESEKTIAEAKIKSKKAVKIAEEIANQEFEVASQQAMIAIHEKSQELSKAASLASEQSALAILSSQKEITTKEVAEEERKKEIAIINAKAGAEAESAEIVAIAQGELIKSELEGKAESIRLDLMERELSIEAEGIKNENASRNTESPEQVEKSIAISRIHSLPQMIENAVKPLEGANISIVDAGNLAGSFGGGGNENGTENGDGNVVSQVLSASVKHKAYSGVIDDVMKKAGYGGNIQDAVTGKNNGWANWQELND